MSVWSTPRDPLNHAGRFAEMLIHAHISAGDNMKTTDTFQFTLILKNVDEQTPMLEDSLVTEAEVAKRLSVKRQAVSLWIKGQRRTTTPFPSPKLKLSSKSPLWKWNEIVAWLYGNQIIHQQDMVENAMFIEDINAALEERNAHTRKERQELVKNLTANAIA